uniref:BHLH domain-containing protein n=1 Tax=Caenorhabditis tropicalis TaxID=1561998 RepID=A0A1I7V2G1_9PELO
MTVSNQYTPFSHTLSFSHALTPYTLHIQSVVSFVHSFSHAWCLKVLKGGRGGVVYLPILTYREMKTPASSTRNSTMPPVRPYHKKKAGEVKRRINTNEKFEELEKLVRNQWDGKLKQEIVLRKAFDLVTDLKKTASNPHHSGFLNGFNQVKNITISSLISLKMDKKTTENYIKELEKILPEYPDPCSSSETIPGEEIIDVIGFDDAEEVLSESQDTSAPSETTPAEGIVEINETEDERKKRMHMEREKIRRDGLTKAYQNLNKFIAENNLWNGNGKPEKIETVSVTINFIRSSQGKQWLDSQDFLLFLNGLHNGRVIAKIFFSNFFQSDENLHIHRSTLEQFINLPLIPAPLDGPIQAPFFPLMPFLFHQQPDPQIPLPADLSNPAVQDDQENVPPVDKPRIFRPFDV